MKLFGCQIPGEMKGFLFSCFRHKEITGFLGGGERKLLYGDGLEEDHPFIKKVPELAKSGCVLAIETLLCILAARKSRQSRKLTNFLSVRTRGLLFLFAV